MVLSLEEKLAKYKAGSYVFKVPDVSHGHWSVYDWINYIDACNGWR